MDVTPHLAPLGVAARLDGNLVARSPIDGSVTARLVTHDAAAATAVITRAPTRSSTRSTPATSDAGCYGVG